MSPHLPEPAPRAAAGDASSARPGTSGWSRSLRIRPERAAVPVARRFVAACVLEALPPATAHRDHVVDNAALVASELVTNAIRASDEPVEVSVEVTHEVVRVAVCDAAPSAPAPRRTSPVDPHGRGLAIVDTVARTWGVTPRVGGAGKTVWAELALDPSRLLSPAH